MAERKCVSNEVFVFEATLVFGFSPLCNFKCVSNEVSVFEATLVFGFSPLSNFKCVSNEVFVFEGENRNTSIVRAFPPLPLGVGLLVVDNCGENW